MHKIYVILTLDGTVAEVSQHTDADKADARFVSLMKDYAPKFKTMQPDDIETRLEGGHELIGHNSSIQMFHSNE